MSDATAGAPAASTAASSPSARATDTPKAVSLTDLDVPFGRLVLFFIKAGLAAIPAIILVMLTIGVVGALLRVLFRFGYWSLHGGYYGW
jgi:hypothetical protein